MTPSPLGPKASTHATTRAGLRAVAAFEACKAALVLIAGFGLLASIDRGAQQTADLLVRHLHLNPGKRIPRIFLEAAAHVSNTQLLMAASFAGVYALLRLVEAYGLWNERRWAEWLAAVSGGIYLPYEVLELVHRVTPLRLGTFTANVLVVAFMAWRLTHRSDSRDAEPSRLPD